MRLEGIQLALFPEVAPYWLANGVAADSSRDPIAHLTQRRQQLLQTDLAPATAWLETAKCHKREVYQWYWRSDKPIFNGKKRCYVGMDGSAAVAAARQAIARRKELDWVERHLKILERSHADAT